jgi:hypothetical protein
MIQPTPPPSSQSDVNKLMETATLQRRVKGGAANFYWIAGLSLINTLVYVFSTGLNLTFVVGLGITQVVDGFSVALAADLTQYAIIIKAVGVLINLFIAGIFVLFGVFAAKGRKWAFVTGMVLYGLDALLLIAFQDVAGFIFHGLFLFFLLSGLLALNKLRKAIPQTVSDPSFPKNIGG